MIKTPTKTGTYRNLVNENGWSFDVLTKAGWQRLMGLSGEVTESDAKQFAQKTADAWRKK